MKIGPLENAPVSSPAKSERKAGAGPAAADDRAANASTAASAKVQLSSTAAALSSQEVGEASFDQAKVDRISQAISDGRFQVNAEVIADKLIANAQDLLGKSGS